MCHMAEWPRLEATAIAPGVPSAGRPRRRRDGVQPNTYARLLEVGALTDLQKGKASAGRVKPHGYN